MEMKKSLEQLKGKYDSQKKELVMYQQEKEKKEKQQMMRRQTVYGGLTALGGIGKYSGQEKSYTSSINGNTGGFINSQFHQNKKIVGKVAMNQKFFSDNVFNGTKHTQNIQESSSPFASNDLSFIKNDAGKQMNQKQRNQHNRGPSLDTSDFALLELLDTPSISASNNYSHLPSNIQPQAVLNTTQKPLPETATKGSHQLVQQLDNSDSDSSSSDGS